MWLKAQQVQLVSPGGTKFLLYTPPGYTPGTPAPLLVGLHGAGEIGDDLNALLAEPHQSPYKLIHTGKWPASRPFIVLSPQLKRDFSIPNVNNQEWSAALIDEVIEYVRSIYSVNGNKIYLTGISLGGAGCWTYAAAFPNKVAAIVRISGKSKPSDACLVKDIPTWAFHGEDDGLVFPAHSIDMVAAIRACQPAGKYIPQLNLLHARGHEGWDEVYNGTHEYAVFDWMLQFTKNNFTNIPPFVSAGIDRKFLLRSTSLHIAAEYFDSDGTIASALWTKLSGPALTMENTSSKILKLSNLQSGTFVFQLQVTDNLGISSSDQVTIEIVPSAAPSVLVVSDLMLMNGAADTDIGNLYEGQVINKNTMGVNDFNVRPIKSSNVVSVRFSVNSNQNTRTPTSSDPIFIVRQRGAIEWKLPIGDYVICATPYPQNLGAGPPGVSQCFKISVYDQAIKTFYNKPSSDISLLSSWGTTTNGGGTAPTSFTGNFQVLNVNTLANQNNPITVGGVESSFWVKSGGTLNVSNGFVGTINTESTATVNINTSQPVVFGSIHPNSTVNFGTNVTTIPTAHYGHVILSGTASTKTLAADSTFIAGTLTIGNDVIVNGAANGSSVLSLSNNVNLQENDSFSPATKFSIYLKGGSSQIIQVAGNRTAFNALTVASGTTVQLNKSGSNTTLELGSSAGGGLIIRNNGQLQMKKHTLEIRNNGSVNSGSQTGRIGFAKGSLTIDSQSPQHSYLNVINDSDSLTSMVLNLRGTGSLFLQDTLFIADSLKIKNGTLNTNGKISLVSTNIKTARIAQIEGSGLISGSVNVQRLIAAGRFYRYLTFPVAGLKVSDVQKYIPITGTFSGASTGAGLSSVPSLYTFNEPTGGWKPYPTTSNTELLPIGKGYAIFIRSVSADIKVIASGQLHQGNFPFALTPDPNVSASNDGWNLIANPYAAPIRWRATGWTRTGMNATAYVRDNTFPGGRFLVWDGTTGDSEFSGFISQGQSFWVRATSTSPSLIVHENAKAATGILFRTKEDDEPIKRLQITLSQTTLTDRTYIKFIPEATASFDSDIDAVKQKNGYFNIATQTSDSVLLAINNVSDSLCDVVIPLYFEATEAGRYTLSFQSSIDETEYEFLLHDVFLDSVYRVSGNSLYDFDITVDSITRLPNRFYLSLTTTMEEPVISLAENILQSNYKHDNQWMLNDQLIEGATAIEFKPIESGNYAVMVTHGVCSKISAPIPFLVLGTEQNLYNQLRIYPNPVERLIHLKGKMDHLHNDASYRIITPTGQEIQRGQFNTEKVTEGIDIPLEQFMPQGIYILMIDTGSTHKPMKFYVR